MTLSSFGFTIIIRPIGHFVGQNIVGTGFFETIDTCAHAVLHSVVTGGFPLFEAGDVPRVEAIGRPVQSNDRQQHC
ncbi:MAG: hypothetical protein ACLFTT_05390 [Candidatus Hydrogenedentota bacterium]